MTGLLLIAVFLGWLVLSLLVVRYFAGYINNPVLRWFGCFFAFAFLMIAPVLDEVVGGWQFSRLCEKYTKVYVNEERAKGRKVFYVRRGEDRFLDGVAVKVRIDPIVFADSETGEVLVKYNELHAQGGWLIRFLGISESNSPLLFDAGCAPFDQDMILENLNIEVVN